jgi:peptide deformylase
LPVLSIVQIGHPVLLERAGEVTDPRSEEVGTLAADMIDTLRDARGLGIAAPQVGRSLRLIVALPIASRDEVLDAVEPLVLVNPEWRPLADAEREGIEGCLSIPGLRGVVPRAERIAWRGHDLGGATVEGEADGLFARVIQHEVDHLDGVLFPIRMRDLSLLATTDQIEHLWATRKVERAGASS